MIQRLGLMLCCASLAWASGTVTPKAKTCATSTIEGAVTRVDAAAKSFSVAGAGGARDFKAAAKTEFRIPGVDAQTLKNSPLSKLTKNARVRVSYCTQDGSPVEVKVER
jgi:hypothetical protein